MPPSNRTEPVPVFFGWHRRLSTFDLDKHDLEGVPTFHSRRYLAVILAHGDEIYNPY